MANEFAKAHMAEVMSAFDDQMAMIADMQKQRTRLIASGTARGKRVTVTVNAEGTVIETKFSANVADLTYSELAHAMTEAAQQAAAEIARKRNELMRPLLEQRARLPKMHEIVEGMPDLTPRIPQAPAVSLAPPNSPERLAATSIDNAFENMEQVTRRDDGVTESGWLPAKSSAPHTRSASAGGHGITGPEARTTPAPATALPDAEEIAPDRRGGVTESGW